MNMTQLKARIEAALLKGITNDGEVFTAERAQLAYKAIYEKSYYGNAMTPSTRDRLLTNRFGI